MASLSTLFLWKGDALSSELALSSLGGIAAFFHFLYTQHDTNTNRFIDLFRDFNARYDKLNEKLNAIYAQRPIEMLWPTEHQVLYDYFNLCAEEYLYFKAGYIDKDVWNSWLQGMAHFASNKEIYRIWQSELDQASYYGFSLSLLPIKR